MGLTRVAQGGQLPVDTRAVSSFPNTTGGTGCALDELEGPSPTALLLETVEALSLKARALRRARGELIKAQALFRAVLRRETVKRGVTRVAVAIKGHGGVTGGQSAAGEGSPGGAAAAAGQSVATPAGAPGGAPPVKSERSVGVVRHVPLSSSAVGPSGVTPVAPKRARSQSARGRGNTGGGGAGSGDDRRRRNRTRRRRNRTRRRRNRTRRRRAQRETRAVARERSGGGLGASQGLGCAMRSRDTRGRSKGGKQCGGRRRRGARSIKNGNTQNPWFPFSEHTHVKTSGSFANTAGPGKRLQISTASSDLDRALGRVRCSVSCPAFPGPVRVGLFPGVV